MWTSTRPALSLALVCLTACPAPATGDDEVGTMTTDGSESESESGSDDATSDDTTSDDTTTGNLEFDAVSILMIVDNSGSMGEEQSLLTTGVFALTDALDTAGIDWRIGVTTSDNGNPWCPADVTMPESGQLVMSSCRERLDEFVFVDIVDVQDLACNDICSLETITVLPTTTSLDPNPAPRPWVERTNGVNNVAEPVDDALRCMIPQGVNGCGFEQQLESAFLSIERAEDPSESNYGFFEEGRLPVLVFLTDEADCSHNPDWEEIFAQDGNKVFWSDPLASFPTSAVCWNAGVECLGDPAHYDSCEPINKNFAGNSGVLNPEAVLHPLIRYNQRFGSIDAIVFGIVGVGEDGEPFYADVTDSDPDYQDSFGIGPGCTAPGGVTAVPPVRLRAIAEANGPGGQRKLYSVCGSNYGPAFADIGQSIVAQF